MTLKRFQQGEDVFALVVDGDDDIEFVGTNSGRGMSFHVAVSIDLSASRMRSSTRAASTRPGVAAWPDSIPSTNFLINRPTAVF